MPVTPRLHAIATAIPLACFLTLDACWLALVVPRPYRPELDGLLSADVDLLAAVLFHLYFAGLAVRAATGLQRQRR